MPLEMSFRSDFAGCPESVCFAFYDRGDLAEKLAKVRQRRAEVLRHVADDNRENMGADGHCNKLRRCQKVIVHPTIVRVVKALQTKADFPLADSKGIAEAPCGSGKTTMITAVMFALQVLEAVITYSDCKPFVVLSPMLSAQKDIANAFKKELERVGLSPVAAELLAPRVVVLNDRMRWALKQTPKELRKMKRGEYEAWEKLVVRFHEAVVVISSPQSFHHLQDVLPLDYFSIAAIDEADEKTRGPEYCKIITKLLKGTTTMAVSATGVTKFRKFFFEKHGVFFDFDGFTDFHAVHAEGALKTYKRVCIVGNTRYAHQPIDCYADRLTCHRIRKDPQRMGDRTAMGLDVVAAERKYWWEKVHLHVGCLIVVGNDAREDVKEGDKTTSQLVHSADKRILQAALKAKGWTNKVLDLTASPAEAKESPLYQQCVSSDGKLDTDEVSRLIREGELWIIVDKQKCKRGVNIPALAILMLLRPFSDYDVMFQETGRVDRIYKVKENEDVTNCVNVATIIDFGIYHMFHDAHWNTFAKCQFRSASEEVPLEEKFKSEWHMLDDVKDLVAKDVLQRQDFDQLQEASVAGQNALLQERFSSETHCPFAMSVTKEARTYTLRCDRVTFGRFYNGSQGLKFHVTWRDSNGGVLEADDCLYGLMTRHIGVDSEGDDGGSVASVASDDSSKALEKQERKEACGYNDFKFTGQDGGKPLALAALFTEEFRVALQQSKREEAVFPANVIWPKQNASMELRAPFSIQQEASLVREARDLEKYTHNLQLRGLAVSDSDPAGRALVDLVDSGDDDDDKGETNNHADQDADQDAAALLSLTLLSPETPAMSPPTPPSQSNAPSPPAPAAPSVGFSLHLAASAGEPVNVESSKTNALASDKPAASSSDNEQRLSVGGYCLRRRNNNKASLPVDNEDDCKDDDDRKDATTTKARSRRLLPRAAKTRCASRPKQKKAKKQHRPTGREEDCEEEEEEEEQDPSEDDGDSDPDYEPETPASKTRGARNKDKDSDDEQKEEEEKAEKEDCDDEDADAPSPRKKTARKKTPKKVAAPAKKKRKQRAEPDVKKKRELMPVPNMLAVVKHHVLQGPSGAFGAFANVPQDARSITGSESRVAQATMRAQVASKKSPHFLLASEASTTACASAYSEGRIVALTQQEVEQEYRATGVINMNALPAVGVEHKMMQWLPVVWHCLAVFAHKGRSEYIVSRTELADAMQEFCRSGRCDAFSISPQQAGSFRKRDLRNLMQYARDTWRFAQDSRDENGAHGFSVLLLGDKLWCQFCVGSARCACSYRFYCVKTGEKDRDAFKYKLVRQSQGDVLRNRIQRAATNALSSSFSSAAVADESDDVQSLRRWWDAFFAEALNRMSDNGQEWVRARDLVREVKDRQGLSNALLRAKLNNVADAPLFRELIGIAADEDMQVCRHRYSDDEWEFKRQGARVKALLL